MLSNLKSLKPRLLAIDPSLTQSGWAAFKIDSSDVESWGVIPSLSTSNPLNVRLLDLQEKISCLMSDFEMGVDDFLVCEGPAPITLNPSSSIKVEQVRGIFETIARQRGVKVLSRLNPRTVQHELLGMRGKQLPRAEVKRIARAVLNNIFPRINKNHSNIEQDAVDAILIGVLAHGRILRSIKSGIDPVLSFEKNSISRNSGRRSSGRGLNWPSNTFQKK